MTTTITGSGGVSQVQDGSIGTADFAANAITAAKLPTGSVIQFVRATGSTTTTSNSSTYASTNASVTITPLSSSSHIYLSHTAGGLAKDSGDLGLQIIRAVSGGATTTIYSSNRYGYGSTTEWVPMNWAIVDVDEAHNTTSAITYTIQIMRSGGGEARHCDNASWNFVAMEFVQ